jgi:hypothetical protein
MLAVNVITHLGPRPVARIGDLLLCVHFFNGPLPGSLFVDVPATPKRCVASQDMKIESGLDRPDDNHGERTAGQCGHHEIVFPGPNGEVHWWSFGHLPCLLECYSAHGCQDCQLEQHLKLHALGSLKNGRSSERHVSRWINLHGGVSVRAGLQELEITLIVDLHA